MQLLVHNNIELPPLDPCFRMLLQDSPKRIHFWSQARAISHRLGSPQEHLLSSIAQFPVNSARPRILDQWPGLVHTLEEPRHSLAKPSGQSRASAIERGFSNPLSKTPRHLAQRWQSPSVLTGSRKGREGVPF